jgi:hypothetical protein
LYQRNPAGTKNLQDVFPSNFSELARTQLPVISGILEVRTLKNAGHSLCTLPPWELYFLVYKLHTKNN